MATGRVDHVICAGARGWDSAGDCDRRRKSKYAECLCCMCEASASPVVNSCVQSFLCVLLQAHDTNMSTRTCAVASACIPTHLLYTTGAMSNRAHTHNTRITAWRRRQQVSMKWKTTKCNQHAPMHHPKSPDKLPYAT